ncbi:MAG: aminoacetone oxidase family FAD-binding enzyme [Saprospiraceae bacterium]
MYDLLVIGGGAAGFFGAISAADHAGRRLRIAILEQSKQVLQKVKISGGGRCNVTHAEFDPRELSKSYPRGQKELLGPFNKFAPGDTMAWFEDRGVPLKIESDNRVFPESDSSQSIMDALISSTKRHGIEIRTQHKVTNIHASTEGHFTLQFLKDDSLSAKQILIATGSGPRGYAWMEKLGIKLVDRVPSLFSFNVPFPKLHALQGLSMPAASVRLKSGEQTRGPILITHWGLSGPAILRLSAEAAISLHACDYKTGFGVSWMDTTLLDCQETLGKIRQEAGKKTLRYNGGLELPQRLWLYLVERAALLPDQKWGSLTKQHLNKLAAAISDDQYPLEGQTRFKDEFVTAGGVDLSMINFRTFGVVNIPGLYIAGELLNIDGITGGFNFQAAWTGGHLAGKAIAAKLEA